MISIKQYFSAYRQYCLIAITGVGFIWSAIAATEFKIFTLQHRFAEEILPVITPLVGKEGNASAIQNNLIIRTTPANMSEIEQVISTLDTARQNLKITVMRNNKSSSVSADAEVSVRKHTGNLSIEAGSNQAVKNGAVLNIESQQNHSNASSTQFIQVTDGEQAFISVGQSIPYTQEWIYLTQHFTGVQRTTEFVNIDIGFAVRPRTVGNQIALEITPRFSKLNQRGTIDFETLTTSINARRGEWINIADIMQNKDDVSRAILSWKSNNRSDNSQISIKIE